jgi:phosphatidylglycerol---prolipoprotein diacylglyceryl transferase
MLPILYHGPDLIVYSYPLLMGLGWGVAYHFFFGLIPRSTSVVKAQFLFWGIFFFAWLGAKILFYLTLPPELAHVSLSELSFWTGGGFVFYGGLLGGLLFLLLYRMYFGLKADFLWPILPALTFGHAVGRVGCLLAGCCYGSPTSWIWGIFLHEHYRHPTQILEILGLTALGLYLLYSKKEKITLLAHYFISYGLLRFGIELLRGDEIRGSWGPLSPSQWISIALILMGSTFILRNKSSAP